LKTDERIKTGYVSQYSFSKVNNAAYHRLFSYCNVIYLVDLKVFCFFSQLDWRQACLVLLVLQCFLPQSTTTSDMDKLKMNIGTKWTTVETVESEYTYNHHSLDQAPVVF